MWQFSLNNVIEFLRQEFFYIFDVYKKIVWNFYIVFEKFKVKINFEVNVVDIVYIQNIIVNFLSIV